jgi:hypothetical protein
MTLIGENKVLRRVFARDGENLYRT